MTKYIFSNIFTRVLCNVLNFILALIITRYYGAVGKGEMTYIVTLVTFVGFFSNIFSSNSLIYSYSKHQFKTIYSTALVWILMVSCIEFVLLKMFIPGNNVYIFHICALTILQSIFTLFSSVLLANKEIKKNNILSILFIAMNLLIISFFIFGIQLMSLGSIIKMLYIAYVISISVGIVYSIPYIQMNRLALDLEEVKIILSFGYKFQIFDFLQFLMLRFSFLLLFQYEGKVSLGVFSIGLSLIESIWIISRSIATLNYIKIANSSEPKSYGRFTLKLVRISLLISILLVGLVFLIPTDVYIFIFGKYCQVLKHYIRWLIPGSIIFPVFIILSSYYSGKGRMDYNIIACGLGSFISIVLGFLLIRKYEMTGTAFTMSISFIVCSLFLFYKFYKSNNFTLSDLLINRNDFSEFNSFIKKYLH